MMGNIADALGAKAKEIARSFLNVGDVHLLKLGKQNSITPKNGQETKDKLFVILGFDAQGDIIGGVVVNSKINYNLPDTITDYQMPIKMSECSFLRYDSFVNCSKLIQASRDKFDETTYRGEMPTVKVEDRKSVV